MSRLRMTALCLALVTLLAYLPAGSHGYLSYDDGDYVTDNHFVQNGLTWAGVRWAFTTWHASNWHPLTWLSLMLDCQLFGLNAGAEHYVNVLFHAANAVLLLLLLVRLTGALWPAALVAALFAWHPLHVESVAWISERKDVLSTFFAMLTLLAYARYAQSRAGAGGQKTGIAGPGPVPASPRPGLDYYLALLCFVLGLMAKPMLVTLPFVMLLLDYWPIQRVAGGPSKPGRSSFRRVAACNLRLLTEKWPFFLLVAASCVVTFLAQRAKAVLTLQQLPPGVRLENSLLSHVRYLGKTVWPVHLAVFYPLPRHLAWPDAAAAGAFLLLITMLAWHWRRSRPYFLVGWLWFLGTLLPVIGLVQVGTQAMADRYTYFPLEGIFIVAAWGARDIVARCRLGTVAPSLVAGAALIACLLQTERQLSYWRDNETLFGHAVAVTQNNDVALVNLGVALEKRGRRPEALADYENALRSNPRSVEAHNNFGNLLRDEGRFREAAAQYCQAIALDPRAVTARENLGSLLAGQGHFEQAMEQYRQAARLAPADPHPRFLMGKALLRQGRDIEAVASFRQALRLHPNDPQTLAFLARVLASDDNPRVRDAAQALACAREANRLTGGGQPFILDTLAMAYAEGGRFQDAQRIERQALQMARAAGLAETNEMSQRLQLYEEGQPWRQSFTHTPAKN
ncbi:MAG: tetratricopeptide repeat protein [Verrucomicrobiota bacterium]|nr:tetratricopeptide repeat protein [Verrucomicrobiota bacterium]